MKPVDLRTSWYFSTPVRLAAAVFVFTGVTLAFVNVYIGFVMIIGGVLAVTTHYRLSIDFTNRTYRDYAWILGLRSGDKGSFEGIQYIFINKTKVSQTMNSKVSTTTIVRDEYNGYLKFSEDNKIHLASHEKKQRLVDNLREIAKQLDCELRE